MNSFSHALPYLDRPYFAIGCCVPDILAGSDRRCRVRRKSAIKFVENSSEVVQQVAAGVVQHHDDDHWFHRSAIFNNLIMEYAIDFRDSFGNDHSMRPSLIAHVLIEMFLDWHLETRYPGTMEEFYNVVQQIVPEQVQNAVNLFATRKTEKLVPAIGFFLKERYVFDYETDAGARYRMNRVLERLKLAPIPEEADPWISKFRQKVVTNANELLAGYRWPDQSL